MLSRRWPQALLAVPTAALCTLVAHPAAADDGGGGAGGNGGGHGAPRLRIDAPSRFQPGRQYTVTVTASARGGTAFSPIGLSVTLPERLVPQSVDAPGLSCTVRTPQRSDDDLTDRTDGGADCRADSFDTGTPVRVTVTVAPGAKAEGSLLATLAADELHVDAATDVSVDGTLPTAGVSGRVWNDLDHDGRQDPGEPGIPGVGVIIGPDRVDTGPDGRYALPDVELGAVSVDFVVPRRFVFSPSRRGEDDGDSDVRGGQDCGEDCAFGFTTFTMSGPTTVDAGVFDPRVAPPPVAQAAPAARAATSPEPTDVTVRPVPQARAALATTGVPVSTLVAIGVLLLGAGIGLLAYSRRRDEQNNWPHDGWHQE